MKNLYQHFCQLSALSGQAKQDYIESYRDDPDTYTALKKMVTDVDIDITQIFNESIELAGEQLCGQLEKGDSVSKYTISQMLGKGGMGSVYLGVRHDGQYAQNVAIKVVPLALLSSSEQVFNYEAQALASLNHSHIVSLLDAGQDERGFAYLVMQYVDGLTLGEYCLRHTLSEYQSLQLFLQIVDGISHAHNHQVLHRDIKPDNILVDEQGLVHIIDFGISKILAPKQVKIDSQYDALSFAYASPEQKSGLQVSSTSDIYSLGKVLADLASDGETIQAIIAKATATDPSQRYQSTSEFAQDIRYYLTNRPTSALNNTYINLKLWFKRHSIPFALSAVITVAAIVGGIQYYQAHIFSQEQALLADSNLKLAENMLKQVDVKVVSEIERQRALIDVAGDVDISVLPKAQAVRFTLSLANAYKTIGDYQQALEYLTRLQALTEGELGYEIEKLIADKIKIELNVLFNNAHNLQQDLKSLNQNLSLLASLSDNRLFALLDWEIGTTTISNPELQKLFAELTAKLQPVNHEQRVLLEQMKLISSSNVSKLEQLTAIETLLKSVENDLSQVSSRRWVSLLHDWYLMSNIQGKQSEYSISTRLVDNAKLLQSLLDSEHPSVYVLAILTKQASIINHFTMPKVIGDIYDGIIPQNIPPSYQTNYYIIELSEAIKQNRYQDSYQIMQSVYRELPNYGENALNYYMQFSVFANQFERQDLYLSHLETLIKHYKSKNNLGHHAYFNYALCRNAAEAPDEGVVNENPGIAACDEAAEFYEKYQGRNSNFYIMSLLSKLSHYTRIGELEKIKALLVQTEEIADLITYPITLDVLHITQAKAYLALHKIKSAAKMVEGYSPKTPNAIFPHYLLKLQILDAQQKHDLLRQAVERVPELDCNNAKASDLAVYQSLRQSLSLPILDLCINKPRLADIADDPIELKAIYSSVDQFIIRL
ncbi:serine/threonine protein kinase [Shewanella halifaxensis]|uniref:serine/threonine protein kinase n=1 Tax=Shewanella halifaxensis TaxID=271098 RepID=UPI000D591667|nr:serine/threonine-protein kinase [Shewanella halifaxensis]